MTTKIKENCIYTDARLIPYEGTTSFKIGTSMCTGCGIRVNAETGEPVEGVQCPIEARTQVGISAETSQEALAQMQKTVDDKVQEGIKEERAKLKDQHEAELASAKQAVRTAKEEGEAALAELREKHTAEMRALKEDHEATLEEINKKHADELKAAKAPPKP